MHILDGWGPAVEWQVQGEEGPERDVTQKAEHDKRDKRDKDQRKGQGESVSWGTRIKEWCTKRMIFRGNGLATAQMENLWHLQVKTFQDEMTTCLWE